MRPSFETTPRVLRQFSGLWIFFFSAAAVVQEFVFGRHTTAVVFASLAVTLGPAGLLWPALMRPVFVGWMTLAYPIGWVISRVMLGVLFFGVFTPVAWIFRIIGRDELGLKSKRDAASYWQEKPQASDQSQYLRQF
jgi:hypothetical protein